MSRHHKTLDAWIIRQLDMTSTATLPLIGVTFLLPGIRLRATHINASFGLLQGERLHG